MQIREVGRKEGGNVELQIRPSPRNDLSVLPEPRMSPVGAVPWRSKHLEDAIDEIHDPVLGNLRFGAKDGFLARVAPQ